MFIKKLATNTLTLITILIAVLLSCSVLTAYISPKYLNVLAFGGYLFPVLWVLNFVCVVINLLRKNWRRLAVSLFIGVLTYGHLANTYQLNGIWLNEEEVVKPIRILSFNTRMFDYYSWTGKQGINEDVLTFINQKDPDVVCFQEFFTTMNEVGYSENHVIARLKKYPYSHIEYNVTGRKGRKFGQATFSKFPIVGKKFLAFKNTSNFSIQTDVNIHGKVVRIFNNHLESVRLKTKDYNFIDSINIKWDDEGMEGIKLIAWKLQHSFTQRAVQAETIASHVKNSVYPVIVCGDFNDTPVSYVYNTMLGDLEDSYRQAGIGFQGTYNGKLPSFRIDFIFHSDVFNTVKFQKYQVNYSDHFPIMATIGIKEN